MLIYFVIAPILLAVFIYLFPFFKISKGILILAQIALLGFSIYLFHLSRYADVTLPIGNYDGFLGIFLRADRLAAIFVMLTIVIFLSVSLYTIRENNSRLFWFLLLILEGVLIGLFLSRDLFNIFVLAEVATVLFAILLMYDRERRSMYDGMVYLMVNVVVMQFYLFGVGYLYILTGALDIAYCTQIVATLDANQLILPYALIMTTIAAKCSLLPLLTFLPKIHSIPHAPVSVAVILSSLQVKSGLYLFLRFRDVFQPIHGTYFFLIVGIITAIFGVVLALSQVNIKSLLAYSTIAQVGLIMVGLSLEGNYAYIGSLYHILSHAVAKAALFLAAGITAYKYRTFNLEKIRGVLRRYPLLGGVTVLAILAMTGAPLFSGNISKYFMMTEANFPLYPIMLVINLGTILVFIKFGTILFGKDSLNPEDEVLRMDFFKRCSLILLSALCLIGGIWGTDFIAIFFGYHFSISLREYLEKVVIFFVSWGIGLLLYKFTVQKSTKLRKIGRFDLGFRGICVSIGGFFAILLVVTRFLI